ncbi:MAG: radical SAM protein [Desulfurococcales archaeon]|nr:radical SAM protein [Desulfurococcales archaeon]
MRGKRESTGALLTVLRYVLGNPVIRAYMKTYLKRISCRYSDDKIVEQSMLYHALAFFAREVVSCPLMMRFLGESFEILMRFGLRIIGGDEGSVRILLKDPALRRGVALVFEGIARYGVTVPQKLPSPFLIVWNFTNMCNLRCKHCYQRADKPLPDELTLEEKLKLVDQLDKAGVASVALSGGEPTIHPHFLQIVKALSDRGIHAAVATNGWMFADRDFLMRSIKAGLRYIEVSVDSAYPHKHDEFRGVRGSWEKAVKALENIVKLGVDHAMAVTITKYNLNEVDDILDLAESIGVKRVVFFNFVPVGRGVDIIDADLDPVQREFFMRKIYDEMKKRKMLIVSTAPQFGRVTLQMSSGRSIAPTHFYVGEDLVTRAVAEFVGGCGAGRIYAGIQPNGDVIPCVFLPLPVGNIRERSFREIWDTSPVFKILRDRSLLKDFCGKCPFKNVCGGCRARAYAYLKDLTAPDPGCIYNLRYWNMLREKRLERGVIKK